MMKRKRRMLLSFIVIFAGLAALSYPFVSYVYHDTERDEMRETFAKTQADLTAEAIRDIEEKSIAYESALSDDGGSVVDPFVLEEYKGATPFAWDDDVMFAYLLIPKLQMEAPVYLNSDTEKLTEGVTHVDGTSMPIGGEGRRAVIAGKRGQERIQVLFRYVHRLVKGDDIILYVNGQRLVYQVKDRAWCYPAEQKALLPRSGEDILTLFTPHPYPENTKRLIVNAERAKDEEFPVEDMTVQMAKDMAMEEVDEAVREAQTRNYLILGGLGIVWIIVIVLFIKTLVSKK